MQWEVTYLNFSYISNSLLLSIYPNPANNDIHRYFDAYQMKGSQIASIAVINIQGCVSTLTGNITTSYIGTLTDEDQHIACVLPVNQTSNLVCFLYCLMKNRAGSSNCSLILLCWILNNMYIRHSINHRYLTVLLVNDTDGNKLLIFSGIAWYCGGNLSC